MNRKICIAFVVGGLRVGGAEQQLYHLLSRIDRNRFRPIVINLGATAHEYWEGPILKLGIPVQYLDREGGRALRLFRVAHVLYRERVQIVHGWMFHCNPYAALAGRLAHVPIRLGSMRESYDYLPDGKVFRRIGCLGLDLIITNSAKNAQKVSDLNLTRAGIRMVPNGVMIPDRISDDERRRMKLELGCNPDNLLVGSIGRLDQNKNHMMLLRTFARLSEKRSNLELLLIGDGPLKSRIAQCSEELGIAPKVRLPGAIPLAARYLQAMDVCCLTSYTEGMPNLTMEAAAAGTPFVSTRCGDSVDLIDHGISGFLVSVDDDAGMAAHVDKLLDDPECRSRMGQASREKMRHDYDIRAMVTRMCQFYEETLAEKRQMRKSFQVVF